MLVLTRKTGQSLLIGDNIEIQIIEIQGDRIRIGINAPRDVSVLRKELLEEVKEVNREAALNHSQLSLEQLGDILRKK